MIRNRMRAATALVLCATTALVCLAPPALATGRASFAGKVLQEDGRTPLSGVKIVLVDTESRAEYRTEPTGANGGFVADVPAGDYTVLIEVDGGAYLATRSVRLNEGDNTPLALTISSAAPSTAALAQTSGNTGYPTWLKWVIVGAIVVGGAALVSDVTDDDEEPSTPF